MIDNWIALVRQGFQTIKDHRANNRSYALTDLLCTAFAMFSLKDPSLTQFRGLYPIRKANLQRIYGITALASDANLRKSLDQVAPLDLQMQFQHLWKHLKAEEGLADRTVLGQYVAVSIDGTGHFCTTKKGCPHCLTKRHKNGQVTSHHQLLAAVQVHPDQATVFPVNCEAMVRQDGETKNDCELNAAKRLLPLVRKTLGKEVPIIALFDALYPNGYHLAALKAQQMRYIIGISDNHFVRIQVATLKRQAPLKGSIWFKKGKKGQVLKCEARFANQLVLNGQHIDTLVNYMEYTETDAQTGESVFKGTWITDIPIEDTNLEELIAVARTRWKIENETFNTLKNQGYHLEHNYGHGKKYLTTNFALLTFLAFLVDQIAQHEDQLFQQALEVAGSRRALWDRVRSVFYVAPAQSMAAIYRFIITNKQVQIPALE